MKALREKASAALFACALLVACKSPPEASAPIVPIERRCLGDDATIEANCFCSASSDCGGHVQSGCKRFACTPAHSCVRTCCTNDDCDAPLVCDDLLCRPKPGCDDDAQCNPGFQCSGGSCRPLIEAVTTCRVDPANAVINGGGSRRFQVTAYSAAGVALPFKGPVTWSATGLAATTTETGISATFVSTATAHSAGTITAAIGATVCTPAAVREFAPAAGLRVVVVSDGATTTTPDETPLSDATVVIDGRQPQATASDGTVTFDLPNGLHTISVFKAGYAYVTVVNTAATDLLIPLKAVPNPAHFIGQFKDTDFANVDNKNGTLHLDVSGASIGGNLIDVTLTRLLGPTQPMTISLGTGTPYGPYDLPEGLAIGLGAQMFGENGGGHYGVTAEPGLRTLWGLGGNAVLGDVLKAIGPLLNGGGGRLNEQLPTMLAALLPVIGTLDSAVTSGLNVNPGDSFTLSVGGAQPSLKLDTAQRLRLLVRTPRLPSYVNDAGRTVNSDTALVIAGVLAANQGFVPLGLTPGIDQGGPLIAHLPDQITDAVGMTGAPGKLPLRAALRHGGLETAPWAFVTLAGSLNDLISAVEGTSEDGFVLSGNVSLFVKGTLTPYAFAYNSGANTNVDLSTAFLPAVGAPVIVERTVTPAADVSGAVFYRLDVGSEAERWLIYYPTGTATVVVPAVPPALSDRWSGTGPARPEMRLQAVSLGNKPGLTYDGVWQFDGTDAADLSFAMDRFSVRELKGAR